MQKGRGITALFMEMTGTAFLVMAITGTAFAIQSMGSGPDILFLSAAIPALTLAAMIAALGSVSGGHFNPAVSWAALIAGPYMTDMRFLSYIVVQILGAILGAMLASSMFGFSLWEGWSEIERSGMNLWLSEGIGTFGLVYLVLSTSDGKAHVTALSVGAFLFAAGIFTSSGAFVNPAVTIARMFTPNASGIMASDIGMFILAQLLGATFAAILYRYQRA